MSEADLRGRVVVGLRRLDAISVENWAYPGTPDVNYIGGWLELKWLRRWPKRPETPVVIEHWTTEQQVWITRRAHRGGQVHVLLQVGREYLLLGAKMAAVELGSAPRGRLVAAAERYWEGGMNWVELREHLAD